eukprot:gene13813-18527_t
MSVGLSDVAIDSLNIDWSNFLKIESGENLHMSREIIDQLEFLNYWDTQKMTFKTSLLGEYLEKSLPELVTTVEKRMKLSSNNDTTTKTVTHKIVDTSTIFMHSVFLIKQISNLSDHIKSNLEHYIKMKKDMISINEAYPLAGKLSSLLQKKYALQLRITTINTKLDIYRLENEWKYSNLKILSELRRKNHDYNNERLTNISLLHRNELLNISHHKTVVLEDIFKTSTDAMIQSESSNLNSSIENQLELLRLSSHSNNNIIEFRAQEEIRLKNMNVQIAIDHQINIALKEKENWRATFELITNELQTLFIIDAHTAMVGIRFMLIIIIGYVIIMELWNAFKRFLTQKLKKNPLIITKKMVKSSAVNSILPPQGSNSPIPNLEDEIIHPDIKYLLRMYIKRQTSLCLLPNVLFVGPAGCGKTYNAEQIIASSGFECVKLNGGDLLSVGLKASGGVLRDIMLQCQKSKRPTIVMIDEADALIGTRGGIATKSNNCAGALYAILDTVRNNSSYVSLLLISRLECNRIDTAILD